MTRAWPCYSRIAISQSQMRPTRRLSATLRPTRSRFAFPFAISSLGSLAVNVGTPVAFRPNAAGKLPRVRRSRITSPPTDRSLIRIERVARFLVRPAAHTAPIPNSGCRSSLPCGGRRGSICPAARTPTRPSSGSICRSAMPGAVAPELPTRCNPARLPEPAETPVGAFPPPPGSTPTPRTHRRCPGMAGKDVRRAAVGRAFRGAKRTLDREGRQDRTVGHFRAANGHSGLAGRRPNICALRFSGRQRRRTATLVYGFYGVGEGGVTTFTE